MGGIPLASRISAGQEEWVGYYTLCLDESARSIKATLLPYADMLPSLKSGRVFSMNGTAYFSNMAYRLFIWGRSCLQTRGTFNGKKCVKNGPGLGAEKG